MPWVGRLGWQPLGSKVEVTVLAGNLSRGSTAGSSRFKLVHLVRGSDMTLGLLWKMGDSNVARQRYRKRREKNSDFTLP